MKALWELGSDTPRSALERALAPFSWAGNTINTYLSRLTEKGFLSVHKDGKSNLYTPLVSREDYLYGSSPSTFLAALARNGLDRRDVDELRSLLDQLEEDTGDA